MAKRQRKQRVQDAPRPGLVPAKKDKQFDRLIAVCIPTLDIVFASFMHDLATAVAYHVATTNDRVSLVTAQGTVLAKTRQTMVIDAQNMGADWIVWLDTDMRFPPDVISRLLESGNSIVTTNAPKRKEPIGSTAHVLNKETKKMELLDIAPSSEIVRIDTGGFAVAAMEVKVFDRLEKPYFWNPYIPERGIHVGEDIYFCSILGKAGIPIMCDLELSEEIGHTGLKDYYLRDARIWKELDDELQ